MPIQKVLTYGLAALLVAAPLPFGSVGALASSALTVGCLILGVLWVAWRSRLGLGALPYGEPLLLGGGLVVLIGLLQLAPLPGPALKILSPVAVEVRERYEPGFRAAAPAARPATLNPWATRKATLRFAAYLVAALVCLDLAGQRPARRVLVSALLVSGGFQAVYGLTEYLSGHQHIFAYAKKHYTDVATGTFINRNHYAGHLEMTIPLAIALLTMVVSRMLAGRGRGVGERLANAPGRQMFAAGALSVLALTMATALACSRSRMGLASTLMAFLIVGLFLAPRGRGRGFAVVGAGVACATVILFSQAGAAGPVLDRFLGAAGDLRGGVGRWSIWAQAAAMGAQFPVMGVGLGTFGDVFPAFRTTGEGIALGRAHNDYLELAVETGLLGLVACAAGLFLVLRSCSRPASARPDFGPWGHAALTGVVAIGLHSLTDFNLAIPANALTLAALVGISLGWLRIPAPTLAARATVRRWLPRSLAPAGLLVAIALLAAAPVLADIDPGEAGRRENTAWTIGNAGARTARLAGRLDAGNADRLFRKAASAGQSVMTDLEVLARAREAAGEPNPTTAFYLKTRLDDAIRLQEEGLVSQPMSSKGHLLLGHLLIGRCAASELAGAPETDCATRAFAEITTALELNPMSAATHERAARVLIAAWPLLDERTLGDVRDVIRRAVTLNGGDRALREAARVVLDRPAAEAPALDGNAGDGR